MQRKAVLLGCGPRARGRAEAYGLVTSARLTACCDLNDTRLAEFADAHGIPGRYTSLPEMLERERPDLVHVVTRPDLRVAVLTQLAEAGVPAVLVEKPACVAVHDYRALRRLAAESNTRFAVNLQLRHHPRVLAFLDEVQRGTIGQVRMVDASAGLPVAGQGVHVLDLMFAFAGYPAVERVVGTAAGYDDIDGTHPSPRSMTAVVTFAGGVRGVMHAGEGYPVFEANPAAWMHKRVAVYGTHGFRHWRMAGWEQSTADGQVIGGLSDYAAEDLPGQAALTEAVLAWIDGGPTPPTHLDQALDEWLVVLACYQSILTRRSVDFPFEPDDDLLERYRAASMES